MRDLVLWGTAVAFLLAAFFTVHVRHELNGLGRENGALLHELHEQERRNDNLEIVLERLRSPGDLLRRAQEQGIPVGQPEAGEGRG